MIPEAPIICGLYYYRRAGVTRFPSATLREVTRSLALNPWYSNQLLVLAGDVPAALLLESLGVRVHRVFDDAPAAVHHDAAHLMKHWMCLWALRTFGEFLWLDWDTVSLREPDAAFWNWCREGGTPKFIHIRDYWATVNCGVYYASAEWAGRMELGFGRTVSQPNDELLWAAVLPDDVLERPEFWWGSRAVNVWTERDFATVTPETYFAHVRHLSWAPEIRASVADKAGRRGGEGIT